MRWFAIILLVMIPVSVSAYDFKLQCVTHVVPLGDIKIVTAVGVHTHTDESNVTQLYIDGTAQDYEVPIGTRICPEDLIWVYGTTIVNVIHVGGNCK